MFPRAALMPPWAATVWDRVGKSLVIHLREEQQNDQNFIGVQCEEVCSRHLLTLKQHAQPS